MTDELDEVIDVLRNDDRTLGMERVFMVFGTEFVSPSSQSLSGDGTHGLFLGPCMNPTISRSLLVC